MDFWSPWEPLSVNVNIANYFKRSKKKQTQFDKYYLNMEFVNLEISRFGKLRNLAFGEFGTLDFWFLQLFMFLHLRNLAVFTFWKFETWSLGAFEILKSWNLGILGTKETKKRRNEDTKKRSNGETKKWRNKETKKRRNEATNKSFCEYIMPIIYNRIIHSLIDNPPAPACQGHPCCVFITVGKIGLRISHTRP